MVKMYLERIKSHIKVRVFIICERLIVLLPHLFYASGSVPVLSFVYRSARRERLFFHIGNYNNTRKECLVRLLSLSWQPLYFVMSLSVRLAKIKFPKNNFVIFDQRSSLIVNWARSTIVHRSSERELDIRHEVDSRLSFFSFFPFFIQSAKSVTVLSKQTSVPLP